MSYTTIASVAGMFPSFTRSGPKGPSDALIQQFIDDVAAEIDAVLQRRFSEAIEAVAGATFAAWVAAFSTDQADLLEKINRFGACGEMAIVFESLGITTFAKMAAEYKAKFETFLLELDGRDEQGKLKADGGRYDKLFDAGARSISPRPDLDFVAGGDQPADQTAQDSGMSNRFSKFDRTEE